MTIKAGEVAFMKITGEPVFVLEYPSDEPNMAEVRRAVMGQDGTSFSTEFFRHDELETLDEQRKRFIAERQELMEKYAPKQSPDPNAGFMPN